MSAPGNRSSVSLEDLPESLKHICEPFQIAAGKHNVAPLMIAAEEDSRDATVNVRFRSQGRQSVKTQPLLTPLEHLATSLIRGFHDLASTIPRTSSN